MDVRCIPKRTRFTVEELKHHHQVLADAEHQGHFEGQERVAVEKETAHNDLAVLTTEQHEVDFSELLNKLQVILNPDNNLLLVFSLVDL